MVMQNKYASSRNHLSNFYFWSYRRASPRWHNPVLWSWPAVATAAPHQALKHKGKQPTQQCCCWARMFSGLFSTYSTFNIFFLWWGYWVTIPNPLLSQRASIYQSMILRPSVTYGTETQKHITQANPVAFFKLSLCNNRCCHRNMKSPTEFLEVKDLPEDLLPDAGLLAC